MENTNLKISGKQFTQDTKISSKYFDSCFAVFQGGGCKAVAYIGAYKEAQQCGIHFDELAGASAGAVIAALIAAGATPAYLETLVSSSDFFEQFVQKNKWKNVAVIIILSICAPIPVFLIFLINLSKWFSLIFKKICNFFISIINKHFPKKEKSKYDISRPEYISIQKFHFISLYKRLGFHKTTALQNFLDEQLRKLVWGEPNWKNKPSVKFADLTPDLHIIAADVQKGSLQIWDKKHDDLSVAEAVCASCSIPVYFTPFNKQYVDGGLLSNCPDFIYKPKVYHRIISFRLYSSSKSVDFKIRSYVKSLISTIIDGAVQLQHDIEQVFPAINIDTGDVQATDFDNMTQDVVRKLIANGEMEMKKFIDKEDEKIPTMNSGDSHHKITTMEQVYSLIATITPLQEIDEVYISASSTVWCSILFPTLLKWLKDKAHIHIYVTEKKSGNEKEHKEEDARRKFLRDDLGCHFIEQSQKDVYGYILHTKDNKWQGVLYSETHDKQRRFLEGKFYDGVVDSQALRYWVEKLEGYKSTSDQINDIELERVSDSEIIRILQKIPIYSLAQIQKEKIKIDENLNFIDSQIRLEKYRQIHILFDLFEEKDFQLFEPVTIQWRTSKSLICPVIMEEYDGRYYVINGKTRVKYAYQHNISPLEVFVIRNVTEPLPESALDKQCSITQLIVTDNKIKQEERSQLVEDCLHPLWCV